MIRGSICGWLPREAHGGESGMAHVDARELKLFFFFTWSLMACICWHAHVRPALAPVGVGGGVMIIMGIGQWWQRLRGRGARLCEVCTWRQGGSQGVGHKPTHTHCHALIFVRHIHIYLHDIHMHRY